MEKEYKVCQSCSMPLDKDPKGGGTHADNTSSKMYCSNCYQQGKFTWPDATAAQMQEFVKGKMKEMGLPGFMASLLSKGVPKLARWKKTM